MFIETSRQYLKNFGGLMEGFNSYSEYSSSKQNEIMKTNKKFDDFLYFTFSFVNGWKKVVTFFHFKWMITLLV